MSKELARSENQSPEARMLGIATEIFEITQSLMSEVSTVKKTTDTNSKDIEQLKYQTEITDQQSSYIKDLVQKKARELVGYPSVYYQKTISALYRYLKQHCHMGSKINTTMKGNYEFVVKGIEDFNPDIAKLKLEHDEYLKEQLEYKAKIKKCMEDN